MRVKAIAMVAIGIAGFALAARDAGANLLENGDFEEGLGAADGSGSAGFGPFVRFDSPNQGVLGWTLGSGSIDVFTQYRGSGNHVVDVTGLHTCAPGGLGPATLEQSFATTLGATYDVAFSMGGCCSPNMKDMAVSVTGAGAPLYSATFSFDVASAPTPGDLVRRGFSFVADGSSATIRFHSLVDSTRDGPYLDDVVVTEVPEPLPALDSFLCYTAKPTKGSPRFQRRDVTLADAFETVTATVLKPTAFCNPASQDGAVIGDAATHAESYEIRSASRHVKRTSVTVQNTIGVLELDTVKADRLLVPSGKSLEGPAEVPVDTADHFACYKARTSKGAAKFPKGVQVSLLDQFDETPRTFDVKKPTHLCLAAGKNGEDVKRPDALLVCYKARPAKGERRHMRRSGVSVANQFGAEQLDTVKEDEVCVPSALVGTGRACTADTCDATYGSVPAPACDRYAEHVRSYREQYGRSAEWEQWMLDNRDRYESTFLTATEAPDTLAISFRYETSPIAYDPPWAGETEHMAALEALSEGTYAGYDFDFLFNGDPAAAYAKVVAGTQSMTSYADLHTHTVFLYYETIFDHEFAHLMELRHHYDTNAEIGLGRHMPPGDSTCLMDRTSSQFCSACRTALRLPLDVDNSAAIDAVASDILGRYPY